MTFRIHPLPLAGFRPLFALSDVELEAIRARRGCYLAEARRT